MLMSSIGGALYLLKDIVMAVGPVCSDAPPPQSGHIFSKAQLLERG